MELQLFEPEDMKTGRGGGKRGTGERYTKYTSAIGPHVTWLREQITGSKDGTIRVKVADLAKAIGMTGKHETSIYWGLKYALFQNGVVVATGKTKDDSPVLVMREKKEGDTLPASLVKALGGAGKGVVETAAGETEE